MGQLVKLDTIRLSARPVYFSRSDLNRLLGLFSRHVLSQEWRDYSIDTRPGYAAFCVYRHAFDQPLYKILKVSSDGGRKIEFRVQRGDVTVKRGTSLEQVLRVFAPQLRAIV